jgi:hypothetical protein
MVIRASPRIPVNEISTIIYESYSQAENAVWRGIYKACLQMRSRFDKKKYAARADFGEDYQLYVSVAQFERPSIFAGKTTHR